MKEATGLEDFDGLRKLEDLRIPFIIPASIYFTSFVRGGPLIKGSRDSETAVKTFTALPSETLVQAGLSFPIGMAWFVPKHRDEQTGSR